MINSEQIGKALNQCDPKNGNENNMVHTLQMVIKDSLKMCDELTEGLI